MIEPSSPATDVAPSPAPARATRPRSPRKGRGAAAKTASRRKGLKIPRVFSQPGVSPFDEVEWERRTAEITGDNGEVMFRQENVEVPKSWSDLATKIAVSKYFYGDLARGADPRQGGRETSVRQLIHRVARTIADWGQADGYFADAKSAETFYDELSWLCLHQYGAFNSPVWFNVGLYQEYGIGEGKGKGGWHWDETAGEAVRAPSQYEYPQSSACFIQSVKDTMEDIMRLATSEAMLFKYGSGTGTDLSPLRSTREKLSGGGRPSGPLSFLRVYDQVANVIKSGGKTRRAAKMNILKDWHPDIEEFIEAKTLEEQKAWALIEQGYEGSYNGEAYGSVMYQNENLSVRVSDEFMQAAIEGKEWWTRTVTDGQPCEKKNARDLLRKIAQGTWVCGDPGMQFDTTIHTWHTCKGTGRQNATNPCSEYLFLDDTACNLASLNLMRFKREDGRFDIERFKAAVRIFITAQEIIVDRASYPIKEIAENSHVFRTLGLGYANLGALIMSYGLGYDSDEGRALAGGITALMTGQAYEHSAEMAARLGPFPGYHDARCPTVPKPAAPSNEQSMLEVIQRHREAVERIGESERFAALKQEARQVWDAALKKGRRHGYRNAQVTVLAPTGTIGFLMDCDTTGIEPEVALVKYKLLAGGGKLKIVNRTVEPALRNLGYSDAEIQAIIAHIDRYETIEDARDEATGETVRSGLKPEHLSVFDCAFRPARGQRSLHYLGHIRMMAAAQPFLSGAISKTVNLPHDATVEDIMNTYLEGWKLGLKAIAIYRDGSKRSAPLSTQEGGAGENRAEDLETRLKALQTEVESLRQQVGKPLRRRLPNTRMAVNHKFHIAGHDGYLNVGLFEDGQPGELFITMAKEGSTIGGAMDTVATLTSLALQYGVPLEALVRKFSHQRYEPSGFTKNPMIPQASSITDYIFRWLGHQFIPGYSEAHRPDNTQPDLPLPGLIEELQKNINRSSPELPLSDETAIMIKPEATESAAASGNGNRKSAAAGPGHLGATTTRSFVNQLDAPVCSNCGHVMVRNGACYQCHNCGESHGCG